MKTDIGFIDNIEVDGVDTSDFPKFCDAFICGADIDGKEATEEQCEWIEDNYPELVNDLAYMSLIN